MPGFCHDTPPKFPIWPCHSRPTKPFDETYPILFSLAVDESIMGSSTKKKKEKKKDFQV
jgi:hypothetical protein